MTLPAHRERFTNPAVEETTVRDVLGDPKAWPFCISDDMDGMLDLTASTILHVFTAQQRLVLHLQGRAGSEAVAIFYIEDQDLRERTAEALRSAHDVDAALQAHL